MRRDRILCVVLLVFALALASPNSGSISAATPTAPPVNTPDATATAQGFLTVATYPPPGPASLSIIVVASYIGPYGSGDCGGGASVTAYEFGDGTEYRVPAPGCAVAPLTPRPTPITPVHWTTDGMSHHYMQAGTYRIRVSGGAVNNHPITAETTVVVADPPARATASSGSFNRLTLVLVIVGGSTALVTLVVLAFVIAAR